MNEPKPNHMYKASAKSRVMQGWKEKVAAVPSIRRILHHQFLRKVVTLSAGTSLSQAVSILVAPLLTRLYSPEDYGVYGTFTGIISVGMIFATWRYEQEFVVSGSKAERHGIASLVLVLALASMVVSVVGATLLAGGQTAGSSLHYVLNNWPWLIGTGIALSGLHYSSQMLSLKERAFRDIGISHILQVVVAALIQIMVALLANNAGIGLPLGMIAGMGASFLYVAFLAYRNRWLDFTRYSLSVPRMLAVARRNTVYPKYLTWSSLCNSSVAQIPIFVIGAIFPQALLGQFVLAQRIVKLPFTLLSQSVSLASFQEGSEIPAIKLKALYQTRVRQFFVSGIGPFIIFFIIAPVLFGLVFGEEWREAGVLTQYLLPGLFIQFVFTPFTPFFTILNELRIYLLWSIFRVVTVGLGVVLGAIYMGNVRGAALGYSIAMGISFIAQHLLLDRLLRARADA